MSLSKWAVCVGGIAIVALSVAPRAQVADPAATFTRIRDAVPGRFFDAASTRPDTYNPNKLIIGLNRGLDFKTFKWAEFRASTAAFSYSTAMDTIRFTVKAPEGYYIGTITYTQRGAGSVVRTGKAAGSANWVVAGYASDLGDFTTNPRLSWKMDLSEKQLTSVPISITNSLFAFSTPVLGSANVAVTSADVVVTLIPIAPQ
jgi:hypothetical protein